MLTKLKTLQNEGWIVMNEFKGAQALNGIQVCNIRVYATKDKHKTKVYANEIDDLYDKINNNDIHLQTRTNR